MSEVQEVERRVYRVKPRIGAQNTITGYCQYSRNSPGMYVEWDRSCYPKQPDVWVASGSNGIEPDRYYHVWPTEDEFANAWKYFFGE